jgi:hypothetical protein
MELTTRDGLMYFAGASDAAIVSGLVALLLRVYSGRSAEEILATDPVFLKDLGLLEALSTNRGNGIAAMARKLREAAAAPRGRHIPIPPRWAAGSYPWAAPTGRSARHRTSARPPTTR